MASGVQLTSDLSLILQSLGHWLYAVHIFFFKYLRRMLNMPTILKWLALVLLAYILVGYPSPS